MTRRGSPLPPPGSFEGPPGSEAKRTPTVSEPKADPIAAHSCGQSGLFPAVGSQTSLHLTADDQAAQNVLTRGFHGGTAGLAC
jgi:hypothetical protein